MKIHIIDNSLKNLGKTVLWQYDRATRLLSVLKHMQVLYHCAVEQFWDWWMNKVLAIDSCGELGCIIWGMLLGVPRPVIKIGSAGDERPVVPAVYRRILKAAFYLMKSGCSYADIQGYLDILFCIDGKNALSKWTAHVSEYGWSTNVDELNEDTTLYAEYYPRLAYAKGTVFIYDDGGEKTHWECKENISATENSSFEALRDSNKIVASAEKATVIGQEETKLLELRDPEGNVRKISGGPSDALFMALEYKFGETIITASVSRKRKTGIKVVDNGDMTMEYVKTEYFDELHPDLKALFEQQTKGIFPYPLGVKSNEIVEDWVVGFGMDSMAYETVRPDPDNPDSFINSNFVPYQKNRVYRKEELVYYEEGFTDGFVYVNRPIYTCYRVIVYGINGLNSWEEFTKQGSDKVQPYGYVLTGNEPFMYKAGMMFPKGLVFAYLEVTGEQNTIRHVYNYRCLGDISAKENTSFDAIKGKIEKIRDGNPFIGSFALDDSPYVDLRKVQHPERTYKKETISTSYGTAYVVYTIEAYAQFLVIINGMDFVVQGYNEEIMVVIGTHDYGETFSIQEGRAKSGGMRRLVFMAADSSIEDVMEELGRIATNSSDAKIVGATIANSLGEEAKHFKPGMSVLWNNDRTLVNGMRNVKDVGATMSFAGSASYRPNSWPGSSMFAWYPMWNTTILSE